MRIALPIFIAIAALFLAVMGFFIKAGLGNSGAALGRSAPSVASGGDQGDARIAATPAPIATDPPGTFAIPQSGTGPAAASNALPGNTVGGGGPPAPVLAALTELRARLSANPKDLAALVALANLEFDAGKFDRAIPFYNRALAIDPSNPDVRTDRATALHQSGHDVEALRDLDQVLTERPKFPQALYNRGVVLRAIGRRTDAVAAFKAFLAGSPHDPRAADARSNLSELGG